jgi:Spy/CpxP family protein refolding chaperone
MKNIVFMLVLILPMINNDGLFSQPMPPVEVKVNQLKTSLDLTEEQTADLRIILQNAEKQAANVRELNKGDAEAIKVAMADLDKETDQQIRNILTPEQQKKYQTVKEQVITPSGRTDREISELKERLKLTDEQVTQIQPILESFREQMQELREDSGGDREQMHSQMRSIMQERDKKIEAILSESQQQEYQKYIQERREEWGKRRGQRGGRNGQ